MKLFDKSDQRLRISNVISWISNAFTILSFFGISAGTISLICSLDIGIQWYTLILISISLLLLPFLRRISDRFSSIVVAKVYSLFSKEMPYSLAEWDITYQYKTTTAMYFKALFTVKALQTGVDYIRVRYNWSGANGLNEKMLTPITSDGYSTDRIIYDGKEFGYTFYKIYSRTSINRDDVPLKLGLEIKDMQDPEKKASPHLLTNINVKTDLLKMHVILPHDIAINPNDVEFLEYVHATDDHHWHRYTESSCKSVAINKLPDNGTQIEWIITHPIIGGKYVIKWLPMEITGD